MTDTDPSKAMNALIRQRGHQPEPDPEPEQEQVVPSFDGGARTTAPRPTGMNEIIRGHWLRGW
jgi:hypothetical protein